MKKFVVAAVAGGSIALGVASVAFAGQPADPGCAGQDRAAQIHIFQDSDAAPGASEWGAIASDRGSTNGEQNRAHKTSCGGDPTP